MPRSIFFTADRGSTAGRGAGLMAMARVGAAAVGVIALSACGQGIFAPPSHSASASVQPNEGLMGGSDQTVRPAYAAPAYASVGSGRTPTEHDNIVRISVSYADLNIANSEGAAQFKRRVMKAIRKICGDADMRDLYTAQLVRTCQRQVWSQNEGQVQQTIAQAQTPSRNGAGGVVLAAR